MTFPTPWTVQWWHADTGATDDAGDPTTEYTPPLDEDGVDVQVIGWAPTSMTEPNEVRVESDLDLFVPPEVSSSPADVVKLPDDPNPYDVVGYPEDYTKGPFTFAPGKVVKLRRAQS